MKFRRLVFLFIAAAIVIAYFTNPQQGNLNALLQPHISTLQVAPLIEYKRNPIYSTATVTYFNPTSVNGRFVAAAHKEQYIGIFGKFWKLN